MTKTTASYARVQTRLKAAILESIGASDRQRLWNEDSGLKTSRSCQDHGHYTKRYGTVAPLLQPFFAEITSDKIV
jgi:hypothetical protein